MKNILLASALFACSAFGAYAGSPTLGSHHTKSARVPSFDIPTPDPNDPGCPLAHDIPTPDPNDPGCPL